METIDMHIHSCYSDGEYRPNELIEMCISKGIKTMSITDHDNMRGYNEINYEYYKDKIKLIKGIELTAKVSKGRLHILGYDLDEKNPKLITKLNEIRTNSYYAEMALLEQLRKDFGIMFDSYDIREIFTVSHNIGRPDIAHLLMKYGYTSSIQEGFDRYLNISYEKTRNTNKTASYEECIDIIRNSNGIPVLAHPNQLLLDKYELELFLRKLVASGLKGIEAYHSNHTGEETIQYLNLARKYQLLISGGSDYHGPVSKPNVQLGEPKIQTLSLVDYLKKRK